MTSARRTSSSSEVLAAVFGPGPLWERLAVLPMMLGCLVRKISLMKTKVARSKVVKSEVSRDEIENSELSIMVVR